MNWIQDKYNKTIFRCSNCNSEIEINLEAGEDLPDYCKHCETEFDEPTPTRYKLLKLVDGEWYAEGTYDTPEALATAAHYLGTLGYEQVKVEMVGDAE